jgi:hypothetical protein
LARVYILAQDTWLAGNFELCLIAERTLRRLSGIDGVD